MALITQISWKDLLDILIVAFIIYQLLLTFRGTKAIPMIAGLTLVLLASRYSVNFGLHTLNWILQNFLTVGLLLVIIIFQPELRRALARFGRQSILRFFSQAQETHMVDEIVRTAASLSEKHIGALIAVERDTKLSNYVEAGVDIDGKLSRRLLESIFNPKSPLHDGAVVVNGGRVAAAACFLPLTINPAVDKDMGTRHRAALGLSEETDALVVVVSEETGNISLAVEGRIHTRLDLVKLREILLKHMSTPGAK
jgi:diadenylate cyclase